MDIIAIIVGIGCIWGTLYAAYIAKMRSYQDSE